MPKKLLKAKKPLAKKPVAKKPVAKKPAAKKPAAKKPAAKKPAAKKPKAKKIATVCLEGYKISADGRCIKDSKYTTIIASGISAPPPPPMHPAHLPPKVFGPVNQKKDLQSLLNARFKVQGPAPEVVKAGSSIKRILEGEKFKINQRDLIKKSIKVAQSPTPAAIKEVMNMSAQVADYGLPDRSGEEF